MKLLLNEFPSITLNNGIIICNFSSFHDYTFSTGEILPACTKEVADKYALTSSHLEEDHASGWTDIYIQYSLNRTISDAIKNLTAIDELDIILVPFPVKSVLKATHDKVVAFHGVDLEGWKNIDYLNDKTRVCRKADPRDTSAGILSDTFCN